MRVHTSNFFACCALFCIRCMSLPSGLFELVMEYMPLPRVWQWSLLRLKRRCKLAPQQAVQDLSVIMDEILCDSAIFAGTDQKNLMLKINRSPQVLSIILLINPVLLIFNTWY